jgi:hypothetical protein
MIAKLEIRILIQGILASEDSFEINKLYLYLRILSFERLCLKKINF